MTDERLWSVDEAYSRINGTVAGLGMETVPLAGSVGRRLAAGLQADRDSPPFRKSVMDGFAVRASEAGLSGGWKVAGLILAGSGIPGPLAAGTAARIMTGAPLPDGADAVIMAERVRTGSVAGEERVWLDSGEVVAGQHVMQQGQSMREGETVLAAGHLLRPCDLGLLAEIGQAQVPVFRRPSVAILATGNELVEVDRIPGAGQIRNSNGPMLTACASPFAESVSALGIATDCREELRSAVQSGLAHDMLVLSGGVSEGLADLVPRVLADLGVRQVFHKIAMKPGKPLWFGVLPAEVPVRHRQCLVFGLPGNPVSSLVCFDLFVRYALDQLSGGARLETPFSLAGRLKTGHHARGPRPTWWPVVQSVASDSGQVELEPLVWQGSSDLRCLGQANAIALFPPRNDSWPAGTIVRWRSFHPFP